MTAFPDSWGDLCLVSITPEATETTLGTEYQYAALTEDITGLDFGDKDIEIIPTLNGGRITKFVPMTEESATIKMYPVSAKIDGTGVVQLMHPQGGTPSWSEDSTDPILVENSQYRRRCRLILLWALALPTTASGIPVATPAYRIQVINAYMTGYKPSYDGKSYSAEITFKWAPFNKSAVSNKREESTGSTALPAVTTSPTSWV